MNGRLVNDLERINGPLLCEEQDGFRKGGGCVDQTFAFIQVGEKATKKG